MKKELLAVAMLLFAGGNLLAQPHVNDGTSYLMNQPLDMSTDFRDLSNTLFLQMTWSHSMPSRVKGW